MAGIVLEKIIEMAVILLCGVLAYKTGLIDKASTKSFSNVLLMLVSPLLVFQSYQMDFEPRLFYGLLQTLFVSFVTFLVCIILAEIFMKGDPARQQIEKMTAIYSNCGFIGIPLINGILGAEGVFYMTAYVTVFNVLDPWRLADGRPGKTAGCLEESFYANDCGGGVWPDLFYFPDPAPNAAL